MKIEETIINIKNNIITKNIKELPQEEIEELKKMQQQESTKQELTLEEKVANLEEENNMLKECILEMSEIIYGG